MRRTLMFVLHDNWKQNDRWDKTNSQLQGLPRRFNQTTSEEKICRKNGWDGNHKSSRYKQAMQVFLGIEQSHALTIACKVFKTSKVDVSLSGFTNVFR